MFCKNCHQIDVIKMNTVRRELESPDWCSDVAGEMYDPDATCPRWLVAIKAFEKVAHEAGDAAAIESGPAESDLSKLKEEAKQITTAMGQESELDESYLKEMLRFGRAKLHNVSAFLGGVAA